MWQSLNRPDKLDYLKLRSHLETTFQAKIEDAYYFNAYPDPATAKTKAFDSAVSYPPPGGPRIRVKLYWLQKRVLNWPAGWGGGPVVHPRTGQQFELTQQKAVDVGLAFHLMRSDGRRKWRTLFFAAGDCDCDEAMQHRVEYEDINVILIGSLESISGELLPCARAVVKLNDVASQISRP